MTAKQSFATILAMLLALVLLGGCSPSSVETPLLTVIFGDTAIPALYIQPFVDRDSVPDHSLSSPEECVLHEFVTILCPYVEHVSIRG